MVQRAESCFQPEPEARAGGATWHVDTPHRAAGSAGARWAAPARLFHLLAKGLGHGRVVSVGKPDVPRADGSGGARHRLGDGAGPDEADGGVGRLAQVLDGDGARRASSDVGQKAVLLDHRERRTILGVHDDEDAAARRESFGNILIERDAGQLHSPSRLARYVAAFDVTVTGAGVRRLVNADVHWERNIHLRVGEGACGQFRQPWQCRFHQ